MAKKQKDEHAKGKINKTTVARKPKAAAPKGARPIAAPEQPAPSLPGSGPDLEARLHLFSVDLGQDETLNAVFTAIYLEKSGDWEAVSAELNSKKAIKPNAVKKLEFTHHLAAWSADNAKLVRAFQKDDRTNSMRDIAANFSRKEFTQLVSKEKAHAKGQTAKMIADNLYNDLFHLQPTAMLQRMVEDPKETPVADKNVSGNVARFLANQPETFNIKTTSVYEAFKNEDAFKGIAPEHHDQIKTELKSLQRVAAISPVAEVVPVLMKANLTSAMMVSDMPEDQFVQEVSKQLGKNGDTVARQVHTNAVNAQIRNEQALISLKETREGTGIAMLDKSMRHEFDDKVYEDALEKNNLSWDLLFGDADFCECEECTSVYSAAAYFVDLLQYLRNNNLDPEAKGVLAIRKDHPKDISNTPLEKLFNRRPDLKCLQLTCQNTNTKLPYVDLVNEVMENYVAFQKTIPFNVGEDETSGELLAEPHHTEYKAYEMLHDAVYPFTLPYHQPIDAARIYLNSLGTSRYELIDTFRSTKYSWHLLASSSISLPPKTIMDVDESHEAYLDNAADAEYLGLTQEEYVILTQEAFLSKESWDKQIFKNGKTQVHTQEEYLTKIGARRVHEYYGYGSESEMLSVNENRQLGLTFVKDQFLKRTGVRYLELVDLLKTQCLNPNVPQGQALSIMDSIQFSYRFLQSLVNQSPDPDTREKKYERVIGWLFLMAQVIRIDDPCALKEVDVPQTEEQKRKKRKDLKQKKKDLKQWVNDYFERVGKIIVLDDGAKCIDGKLSRSSDNRLVDIGLKIENCQIINEVTGVVVGSIDKTTGLVTPKQGQPSGDLSKIIFTGNNGQNGSFVYAFGKYYLVTTKIDTCDLETVRLIHLDGSPLAVDEYDHIHRFIRLWRKLGWTINETDNALVGLGNCDISPQLLHQLVAVKKLYEKTGLEQIKLLSFWTNISTVGEKSLYKSLFLTHNLLAVDRVFHADDNGRYLAVTTLKISEHVPVLMAALNLNADDIDAIMAHEQIKELTMENVSKLYRYRLLSKILGLRIPDFISVLPVFGNPFTNADATLLFLEKWGRMEDAGFTYGQLNYIIRDQDDPKKPLALTQKMALQLAKNLYDGLNAIEAVHQDVHGTTDEKKSLAAAELVKEKAALLYDQVTVEKIVGILEGTTIYSAKVTKDIKDLLKPIPSTTDFEILQFDNYPLLKKKIRYDAAIGSLQIEGSLQIKGILTDFEEKGSSKFFTDDFTDLSGLVTKLTGSDPLSKYLWSEFSVLGRNTIATASSALQQQEVARELNDLITKGTLIFDVSHFDVQLSESTKALRDTNPVGDELTRLNRLLLEDAYPLEIEKNQRLGFLVGDFKDFSLLLSKLMSTNRGPVSQYLWDQFSSPNKVKLNDGTLTALEHLNVVVQELNSLIAAGTSIYTASRFSGVILSVVTEALRAKNPTASEELIRLNRLLLEDAYPLEIAKNTRVGLNTILENLQPNHSLKVSLESIKNQQTQFFHEVFDGVFASPEIHDLSIGDINEPSIDAGANIDNNTAPLKRIKFLEIFLPYLRKELIHRFIVNTLSSQAGLGNDVTDMLITKILKTGAQLDKPVYDLFESIKAAVNPVSPGWDGYLIPSAEEQYTFIVKDSTAKPDLSLEGGSVDFEKQPNSDEWWSKKAQKLQAGKLYKLILKGMKPASLYWKTATSSITLIPSTSLLPGYAEDTTIKAFAYLKKAALLINGFKLSADEIQYLSDHPSDFSNLNLNEIKVEQFLRLESYTRLRNSLPAAKINILEFFNWTHRPAGSTIELIGKIGELSGWKEERVKQLIHKDHFNLLQPKFHDEISLLKLQKALEVADKIGMSIDLLFEWANPDSDFAKCRDIADGIQHAIRAQYKQEDWEQLVKPLNDRLRENQKNALIAYLLVLPRVMEWGVTDADGLFEFFLIDVQMDPCMETSRIVQAISSVQLFVQRCFLGLEEELRHSDIKPNLLDRGRWDWMQRYRVWEANRKVFLYPENWIESNLRDDKSSFFKELESELLQKDINKQNVEDALKAYLYKVDEVANMEVVGLYIEGRKKLHVFSRTRNAPYMFFYRHLDIAAGNWYPWEKMQVDIPSYDMEVVTEVTKDSGTNTYKLNPKYKTIIGNGCYLTPVVWNERLLIFFPQFMRKTKPNEEDAGSKSIRDMSEDSTDSSKPIEFWEIKMAWSEYRNGKWTQKQLSKDAIYDIPAVNGFWKAFYDVSKARAKADAANKEVADTWADYGKEEGILGNYHTQFKGIPFTIITNYLDIDITVPSLNLIRRIIVKDNPHHPLIIAIKKHDTASKIYSEAIGVYNTAVTRLNNAGLPTPASDISNYEFVPVILTANLLSIELYYDQRECGAFGFDGSNIIAKLPNGPRTNSTNVDRFHHSSSIIKSLQLSNSVNNVDDHKFDDPNSTTYITPYNTIKFYHSDSHKLLGIINAQQLEPLFKFPLDGIDHNPDKDDVFGGYDQDADTLTPNIYHELKRPYSIYNWELFFHTPMMLADALSKSQQFEEAMKWYHYVFNPIAEGDKDNRFWQFSPFKEMDAKHVLDHIFNQLKPNESDDDINEWRNNPFKPHLVARSRPVAYMKWVVMKYVDNLVAWGDYLFRQDTIESINQATQLYILAWHILGPRPQMIPKRGTVKPQTYLSLLDKWDAFSNAMSELEVTLPFSSQTSLPFGIVNGVVGLANVFGFSTTTYFCIPNNPKLIGYWDTISDRLFKIRHCENIEGIFRKLPLFEPPIDPALLVKAAAQGLSIASILNDLNTPMPNYRFYYLLQKALELCGELKSMGAAMLSAIEKKDNETISLIRARHESSMLNLVMEIKKQQLEEAQKALEGLQQNRKSPEHRMKYYLQLIGEDAGKVPGLDSEFGEIANVIETPIGESGLKLIKYEKEDMDKANLSADLQLAVGVSETLAGILYAIPMIKADVAPMGIGAGLAFGGTNLGQLTQAIAKVMQLAAGHLSHQSTSAAKKGGFLRSLQDRVMQANAAGYELKQIDKQILSQQIRIVIANLEITNHQKQIDNAQEIEEFLKNKYSNEELYSWMKDSLGTLYHQVYSLAFELSKKAEKVFRFERGLTNSNFIQAGYWDAGYNGLLSGEQLYVGLKQLEAAYHENRGYDYEITKHVSVRQINPLAILQLKQTGICEFALPEVLFDIDYPGHYKRRIKSVSITIPCVAGPYVGLNGTLRQLENKFRNSAIANNYPERTGEEDDRFQSFIIPINAIAASSGQNDSGMFELNFKDERYLPFEGAGVISRWRFELPTALRQFDYDSISDVVIHIRYTSAEGGASLKLEAGRSVTTYINRAEQVSKEEGLFAIFDLKHDFPTQWHQLLSQNQQPTSFEITNSHFPYLFNGRTLEIIETKVYLKPKGNVRIMPSSDITLNTIPISGWNVHQDIPLTEGTLEITGSPIGTWAIDIVGTNDKATIDDFLILIRYRVNPL